MDYSYRAVLAAAFMATFIVSGSTARFSWWMKDRAAVAEVQDAMDIPWRYGQAVVAHIWYGLWFVVSGRRETRTDTAFSPRSVNRGAIAALVIGGLVLVIVAMWLSYR